MDVDPSKISPDVITAIRNNPACREIMTVYLTELPVGDDEQPLTWQHALELMVLKLTHQYSGALSGWKDSATRNDEARRGVPTQKALGNETDGKSASDAG